MDGGRCTVVVGDRPRRARRQPAAHPRAARAAAAARGPTAVTEGAAGAGAGHRPAAPPYRPARGPPTSTTETRLGGVYMRLAAARAAAARARHPRGAGADDRAAAAGVLPGARASPTSTCSGMPLAWLLLGVVVYPCWCCSAGATYDGPSATSATSPSWCRRSSGEPRPRRRPRHRRGHAGHPRDAGDRHLGAAVLADDERLLRRLAHGATAAERERDRRRVPLRRVLPRRRRAGADVRRRHALVPGRLDRRLPGAAGPGGRAAAPLGRLHAARLRRGPARLARRPGGLLGAGGRDRLALPAAAVPGRRDHPARRPSAPRRGWAR